MSFFKPLVILLSLSMPSLAFGASCCSGGSNLSSIITNDDRFQTRLAFLNEFVVGRVGTGSAIFNDDFTEQRNLIANFSAAYSFHPRWQAGLSIPFQYRVNGDRSKEGPGDLRLNSAFEVLPLYEYSVWKPRVFVFATAVMPSGESAYNTRDPEIGSFGRGFYSLGGGFLLSKDWLKADAFLSQELLHSFKRSFAIEEVEPGMRSVTSLGAGYHFGNLRVGSSLGLEYEGERKFLKSGDRTGYSLVWNLGADLTYRFTDLLASTLTYADQTLIGPARNTSLSRSLSLGLRLRTPR